MYIFEIWREKWWKMHWGHNKYAFWEYQNQNLKKENTPTHTPSLPQIVCTLAQIYSNCAIHWLEKVTKNRCQQHHLVLWSFWTWFGVNGFYTQKNCYFEFEFLKCKIPCILFFRFFFQAAPNFLFCRNPLNCISNIII